MSNLETRPAEVTPDRHRASPGPPLPAVTLPAVTLPVVTLRPRP